MSGTITTIKLFVQTYGRAVSQALLLHTLLLFIVLQAKITQPAKPVAAEPIAAYWYQPAKSPAEPTPIPAAVDNAVPEPAKPAAAEAVSTPAENPLATAAEPALQTKPVSPPPTAEPQPAVSGSGIALRALNRAAAARPAAIDQAAAASYQQFIQAQQQPKLTVEPQHQALSSDPALQVVARLDNGQQLIRSKDGCRIADPSKDGFAALMAARVVPCGDEQSNSALLKQVLEKHLKR